MHIQLRLRLGRRQQATATGKGPRNNKGMQPPGSHPLMSKASVGWRAAVHVCS